MSWREAVLNVVLCVLLFSAGYAWFFYTVMFGSEADRQLVVKALLFVGAVFLAVMGYRYAVDGGYCFAAILQVFALLMLLAAIFAV